jgi:DNA-binding IclR family transcriptional regulator
MEELSSLTKETVLLTTISGTKGIVLERVESELPIRFTLYQPGASIPLYCGASGKILMAYLHEEEWDRIINKEGLHRYTPNTITEIEELKTHLRKIRRRRYAFSDQEVERDARAVAAPILNRSGELVAGLSIVGPMFRINKRKMTTFKGLIIQYAHKISTLMG